MSSNGVVMGAALALSGGSFLYWGPDDDSGKYFAQDQIHSIEPHVDLSDPDTGLLIKLSFVFLLAIIGTVAGCLICKKKENTPPQTKGTLRVHILKGNKLKNVDTGLFDGKSDPCLRAAVGKTEFTTPVVNDNLNPDWGAALKHEGTFDNWNFDNIDVTKDTTLSLEVLDSDHHILRKDVYQSLGQAQIRTEDIAWSPSRWERKVVALYDKKGKISGGTVELELWFEPAGDAPNAQEFAAKDFTKLQVNIYKGVNLLHMNKFVDDKPYVICEVVRSAAGEPPVKCQTKPCPTKDGEDPVWDEEHLLQHWSHDESLQLTVENKGLISSRVEGKATIPASLFYPGGFNGCVPVDGVPNGEIHVNIQFPTK